MMTIKGNIIQQRVAFLNWALPLALIMITMLYWLGAVLLGGADRVIPFGSVAATFLYAISGPVLAFWALKRIGRWLVEEDRTRQNVNAREHPFASIVTTAADAILSIDDDGRIEFCNPGAEKLMGFTAEELVSQPLSALLSGGAAAEVEASWLSEMVRREGYVRGHETTCRDINGRMMDVDLTATLCADDQGKPVGMSVILRDITQRKRREQETQHLTVSLNQQAAQRTRELADKVSQLALANTELYQLDQTRSEFVSLVSHQIRAPLTNITGAVQRMRTDCGAISPTCSRMFVIMEQQISRLDRLVQDVLNAARIEAGEMPFHVEPISALPLVRQAAEQFHARISPRVIRLTDKPGLPLIFADRDRVAEALANLLDNADKYSPLGAEVVMDVRADQSEVTFSIRDFGPGLPVEKVEHIFDKFYRADSTDSQTAYGYGLGLYVCRILVEAQHGRIWAENHPDGGAVFSFALPVWQD